MVERSGDCAERDGSLLGALAPGRALPGGCSIGTVRVRDGRIEVELVADAGRVTLDLQPDSGDLGPFGGAGIRATYRRSEVPFERFAPAARWLVESLGGADALRSFVAARSRPQVTRFVRERDIAGAIESASGIDAVRRALGVGDGPADVSIYLEAPCEQACIFCVVPHERVLGRRDGARLSPRAFESILRALAPTAGSSLRLLGDDYAAHPSLDAFFDLAMREPRVAIEVFGPGTRLSDAAFRTRLVALPNLRRISLTLQSLDPDVHDAIVGRRGAGKAVLEAVEALAPLRRGAEPLLEVNTVLVRPALPHLADLVAYLARRGVRCALAAYQPDRTLAPGFDPAVAMPSGEDLARALMAIVPEAAGTLLSVKGVPRCCVPTWLASRSSMGVPSPDAGPMRYEEACADCAYRSRCPGVPDVGRAALAYAEGRGVAPTA